MFIQFKCFPNNLGRLRLTEIRIDAHPRRPWRSGLRNHRPPSEGQDGPSVRASSNVAGRTRDGHINVQHRASLRLSRVMRTENAVRLKAQSLRLFGHPFVHTRVHDKRRWLLRFPWLLVDIYYTDKASFNCETYFPLGETTSALSSVRPECAR
jgi:hypothetical protein